MVQVKLLKVAYGLWNRCIINFNGYSENLEGEYNTLFNWL